MRHYTYHGEVDINYILQRSKTPSDVLVVVFPGNADNVWEANPYIFTIGAINVNALYIIARGMEYVKSRMTAINRDFSIERSIIALVNIAREQTESTRIIMVGSSMGGFCAIYYGLKYDYEIIAGSPGYPFLTVEGIPYPDKDKYTYMAGGYSDQDIAWCNEVLPNVIKLAGKRGHKKAMYIMWGDGEPFWTSKYCAPQLLRELDAASIIYTVELEHFYIHNMVGHVFNRTLKKQLALYIGDEPMELIIIEPPHLVYQKAVNESRNAIRRYIKDLTPPDTCANVQNRWFGGEQEPYRQICVWAYGSNGYHLLKKRIEEPLYIKDAIDFWTVIPSNNAEYALSFWYPQTLLNHFKATGNLDILHHIEENILHFDVTLSHRHLNLVDPRNTYGAPHNAYMACKFSWWRVLFYIDYLCAISDKRADQFSDKVNTHFQNMLDSMETAFMDKVEVNKCAEICQQALIGLHLARFFRDNLVFFDKVYQASMEIVKSILDYCFDENGVCIIGQISWHLWLQLWLTRIAEFLVANSFPESISHKRFMRMLSQIQTAGSYFVRQDGYWPAIGYEDIWKASTSGILQGLKISPRLGHFLKPTSNMVILSEELAYITIHGGSNRHADIKHCDLLSFTFHYDQQQLVFDAGGGLEDYSMTAIAHSALIVSDEQDYLMPDYSDFTAIEDAHEQDGFVLITGRHRLYEGVTLTRKFMWIKPNVMLIHDTTISDTTHVFTQNYLLPNVRVHNAETAHVVLDIADGFTLTVSQMPVLTEPSAYALTIYTGTTNVNAPEHEKRGSRVVAQSKLVPLKNLAYDKRGTGAEFLTVLEAHSGKPGEVSVRSAYVEEGLLRVELSDGTIHKEARREP